MNKRRKRILVFTHLAGIDFKLGYRGLGEPRREGGGLRRFPYICEREKHYEREMRSEYNQEIARRVLHYGPEQSRNRDLVYVGPYHKINDDREG